MSADFAPRLVRSADELARLEPPWWELWTRVGNATPFQSPAWLLAWWHAFRPGTLASVAVWHGERLAGLAPFYLEEACGRRRLLPVGIGITDHLDVLADDAVRGPVLAAMARALGEVDWAEWELAELSPDAAAHAMPALSGCMETEEPGATCPALALGGPEGLSYVPARTRRKLRMTRHRLAREGRARFIRTSERPTDWWIQALQRLHAARWAMQGETGVLVDPRVVAFHRSVLESMRPLGLLRLGALLLGERVAGVYYGLTHRHRAYAYLGGFDPALAYFSPGTALIGAAIAEAAAEGCSELDFLRGGEGYKYGWGAHDRWSRRRVFRRSEA